MLEILGRETNMLNIYINYFIICDVVFTAVKQDKGLKSVEE